MTERFSKLQRRLRWEIVVFGDTMQSKKLIFAFAVFFAGGSLWAQPAPMAKPEDLGLRIPAGQPALEVQDRCVVVPADLAGGVESDSPAVAKVYLEIGSHYIVIMPDGALRSVAKRETTETDRKFEPLSKDDLAKQLKREFPKFKTRATRRYLCVYNTSDSFCERKTKILETMYPMLVSYFKRQKLKPVNPDTPLVVVMFRTKKELQDYRKTPDSMLAYYNSVNNRIFMYQLSDMNKDAPLIAIKQSTSTIAHEGVHQILHNIGVQKRLTRWPLWLSEGLAEYFAPTSAGLRSKWSGVGKPNELRMRDLFIYLSQHPHAGDGSMLNHLVTADQLNSTDYAIAWSLVHYLTTKKKKEFFEYTRDVSDDLPLQKPEDELVRFMRYFGSDLRQVEREMLTHIRSLPYSDPLANQPYFLVTAKSGKRKFATVTSSIDLTQIKKDMLKKIPASSRPKTIFNVRRFPNRASAVTASKFYMR